MLAVHICTEQLELAEAGTVAVYMVFADFAEAAGTA